MRLPNLLLLFLLATPPVVAAQWPPSLRADLERRIAASGATVGLVLTVPETGMRLSVGGNARFHAASTMKVAVLIELARRIDAGGMSWSDTVTVRNAFRSIVDSSDYHLNPTDDSDSTLYRAENQGVAVRRLAELMITRSSNLATNLLVARLGPVRIQATARALGADSILIRRGVEDGKAYAAGLNNTLSAQDLAALLSAIVSGRAASAAGTAEMTRILLAQEFNDRIPAGLPPGTPVAHKTGEITALAHDAAIIYPAAGPPYVLVVLTSGLAAADAAAALIADLSRMIWRVVTRSRT